MGAITGYKEEREKQEIETEKVVLLWKPFRRKVLRKEWMPLSESKGEISGMKWKID